MATKKKVRKIQGPPMKITAPAYSITAPVLVGKARRKVAAKLKARAKAKKA